ncbi:hypothetical protein HPB50_020809 [Hyalomma asiaticum]|uniref:Uncharacterized protein n=1 Tax=Hyalomma asiaticum TaxID=266040 RepID=A0ACB7T120_HYAAI|nr:hypothetical protein HPB50_020809 [Hyalomma asiaticum]
MKTNRLATRNPRATTSHASWSANATRAAAPPVQLRTRQRHHVRLTSGELQINDRFEADHLLRYYPYRQMGLRGYINAPPPLAGPRPRDIREI